MTHKTPVSLLTSTPAPLEGWTPDTLQRLDSLFAFYHRQWWCHRRTFTRVRRVHAAWNGLALLIVAAGLIVGPVLDDGLLVACLAALGTAVKGWTEFKKFAFKVDMARWAYTTYAKTLIELRTTVCGVPSDAVTPFLIKMQTLDDVVTDVAPPLTDRCLATYAARFEYVPMHGDCYVDGCARPLVPIERIKATTPASAP